VILDKKKRKGCSGKDLQKLEGTHFRVSVRYGGAGVRDCDFPGTIVRGGGQCPTFWCVLCVSRRRAFFNSSHRQWNGSRPAARSFQSPSAADTPATLPQFACPAEVLLFISACYISPYCGPENNRTHRVRWSIAAGRVFNALLFTDVIQLAVPAPLRPLWKITDWLIVCTNESI